MIHPDWPAPSNVLALSTTRYGGSSTGHYQGLNLGDHVGDRAETVLANRQWLLSQLPPLSQIQWLTQVHSTDVVRLPCSKQGVQADASISQTPGHFCTVMTADCLPVLICDRAGTQVAAVHAGWRGLCDGIIEQTIAQFAAPMEQLLVWLGPAIGPDCFEVGAEVRSAFIAKQAEAEVAFVAHGDRYLADIYQLARLRLQAVGIHHIYGGNYCTVSDPSRFYSYRRSGTTGRQASLIGLLDISPER